MAQAIFTPQADDDVFAILTYIARDSISRSDSFLETLNERCQLLADNPKMGRTRNELRAGLRSWPIGNFLICYRLLDDDIEIVRVLHGARNIAAILDEED